MTTRLPPWQPANNGAGMHIWFLIRDMSVPLEARYHCTPTGRLIRYKSYALAKKAADRLNRKENNA